MHKITKIGELATKENEVEQALNKMITGITQHEVKIMHHEEFKMPYVIISAQTIQTMKDYIQLTNELLANKYNTPFLEKLTAWEKKIKITKANLQIWADCQAKWLSIQPTFMPVDTPHKMPVTYKIYEKMQRIWRRLIRLARDTAEVDIKYNSSL